MISRCFQGVHDEIMSKQQPILSLIYKAEQLTENYQEELTPEQVTELTSQSAVLKAALDKVSSVVCFPLIPLMQPSGHKRPSYFLSFFLFYIFAGKMRTSSRVAVLSHLPFHMLGVKMRSSYQVVVACHFSFDILGGRN